jgi:hypothetical protein
VFSDVEAQPACWRGCGCSVCSPLLTAARTCVRQHPNPSAVRPGGRLSPEVRVAAGLLTRGIRGGRITPGPGQFLFRWWASAHPVGSAPEQPRQHRSAAGGAVVGCAAASLLQGYAGQHLIDVLTASGVAGLAAGTARGGTAHEVLSFRGVDGRDRRPSVDIRMAVERVRCGAPEATRSNLANTLGGIKRAGRRPWMQVPLGVLLSNRHSTSRTWCAFHRMGRRPFIGSSWTQMPSLHAPNACSEVGTGGCPETGEAGRER